GQLDMEKSSNGLELKLRESISHEKSAEIQKGVRNENIPNPFCRQTERRCPQRLFFCRFEHFLYFCSYAGNTRIEEN
ncbi:hypothetical protein, partial [Mesobacillus sp.]|uniref:hypothetical protein n=1 Tax=Mesobacillus sp. TaxID=2675271 RepID=UPI0039EFD1F3